MNWITSYLPSLIGAAMMADELLGNEEIIDWDFVEKEYDKICQKKSNLSRKEREAIIKVWEEHIEDEK